MRGSRLAFRGRFEQVLGLEVQALPHGRGDRLLLGQRGEGPGQGHRLEAADLATEALEEAIIGAVGVPARIGELGLHAGELHLGLKLVELAAGAGVQPGLDPVEARLGLLDHGV
ncbi:hypothetical protein D3C78_1474920 [compost metagenome]